MSLKKLMEEVELDTVLIREQGNREVMQAFHMNHGPELIRMCDGKLKEVISNAVNKEDNSMRHHGEKLIKKAGKTSSMLVKERMREVDADEEEINYVTSKFKNGENLTDKMARININKIP